MVEKEEVLPVGSIVTVKFAADRGSETTAVIVGHLSLLKKLKCCYDYICVGCPAGIEEGAFHINHTDVVNVLQQPDDPEQKHRKWMERKYGEYMAYYNQYRSDLRPSIDELRRRKARAEDFGCKYYIIRRIMRITATAVFILGVGLSAWHLKSVLPVPVALFCAVGHHFGR